MRDSPTRESRVDLGIDRHSEGQCPVRVASLRRCGRGWSPSPWEEVLRRGSRDVRDVSLKRSKAQESYAPAFTSNPREVRRQLQRRSKAVKASVEYERCPDRFPRAMA